MECKNGGEFMKCTGYIEYKNNAYTFVYENEFLTLISSNPNKDSIFLNSFI